MSELMMPKSESNSHAKTWVTTIVGTAQTNTREMVNTMRAQPLMRRISSATPRLISIDEPTAAMVNTTVLTTTCQNVPSVSTVVKFCHPTNFGGGGVGANRPASCVLCVVRMTIR